MSQSSKFTSVELSAALSHTFVLLFLFENPAQKLFGAALEVIRPMLLDLSHLSYSGLDFALSSFHNFFTLQKQAVRNCFSKFGVLAKLGKTAAQLGFSTSQAFHIFLSFSEHGLVPSTVAFSDACIFGKSSLRRKLYKWTFLSMKSSTILLWS